VLAWDRLADQCKCGLFIETGEARGIHAIALEAFGAAKPAPLGDELRLAPEDAEQHLLMVAENEDRPNAFLTVGPQPLDHLSGMRAAVDQVAEKDQQCLA